MPTVSAPTSRAMRATIGAAPVPVPPPAPAVMKIMSLPFSSALTRSYSSIAEARPRSGSEPDPRPRVSVAPMCSVTSAFDCWSDWRSVLMATNSTPSICASTMRLTALTPAAADADDAQDRLADGRASPNAGACERAYGSGAGAPGGGGAGASGGGAMTFSGMSDENAWRRRSCGVGMRRSSSGCGSGAGGSGDSDGCARRALGARLLAGLRRLRRGLLRVLALLRLAEERGERARACSRGHLSWP